MGAFVLNLYYHTKMFKLANKMAILLWRFGERLT